MGSTFLGLENSNFVFSTIKQFRSLDPISGCMWGVGGYWYCYLRFHGREPLLSLSWSRSLLVKLKESGAKALKDDREQAKHMSKHNLTHREESQQQKQQQQHGKTGQNCTRTGTNTVAPFECHDSFASCSPHGGRVHNIVTLEPPFPDPGPTNSPPPKPCAQIPIHHPAPLGSMSNPQTIANPGLQVHCTYVISGVVRRSI